LREGQAPRPKNRTEKKKRESRKKIRKDLFLPLSCIGEERATKSEQRNPGGLGTGAWIEEGNTKGKSLTKGLPRKEAEAGKTPPFSEEKNKEKEGIKDRKRKRG